MTRWIAPLVVVAALVGAEPTAAAEQRITLTVENMTCASCPVIVKAALARVDGVRDVQVSFERKSAVVSYEDSKVTVPTLIDASTRAGYPARVKP